MTVGELVENLGTIWEQVNTTNLKRKINDHIKYLEKFKDSHDRIFDHPYYLAPFTYQGMVDFTESL